MRPVDGTGTSLFRVSLSAVAIIPARYHSTRLPGKALADIGGRPMIEHVYRRAA
ncbi:MAG: cytidylyltransferase domain-containing protein, partial [Vicinamibacterales bacterium]